MVTYKKTSERLNFLTRTGSHSTKPPRVPDKARREIAEFERELASASVIEAQAKRDQLVKEKAILVEKFKQVTGPTAGGITVRSCVIDVELGILNRHISNLKQIANQFNDNTRWRKAMSFALEIAKQSEVEAYFKVIARHIRHHGCPPATKKDADDFAAADEQRRANGDFGPQPLDR